MSTATALVSPITRSEIAKYAVRPRDKRFFNTSLDASDLFRSKHPATVEYVHENGASSLSIRMPVVGGHFEERCTFEKDPHFRPVSFDRKLAGEAGSLMREERVDFRAGVLRFPDATYPETMLPFLLRGQPLGKDRRSLYAWICDRFVAKVYYEVAHTNVDVRVPAGSFEATEVIMYPDLNDWVHLGSVLTRLAKPFLPKYHMWFTDKLVRFEGPYGPPGAPEIVLELVD